MMRFRRIPRLTNPTNPTPQEVGRELDWMVEEIQRKEREEIPVAWIMRDCDMAPNDIPSPFFRLWIERDLPKGPKCLHCNVRFFRATLEQENQLRGYPLPPPMCFEVKIFSDDYNPRVEITGICGPCVEANYTYDNGAPVHVPPPHPGELAEFHHETATAQ